MANRDPLRVLVANRGEIAARIFRTLRTLRIPGIAVYSEADRGAPHVRAAEQAIPIGPAPPAESYLSIDRILAAGRQSGANAVHPGYGFLSENPAFAEAVENEGWIFLGPSPDTLRAMADKTEAGRIAHRMIGYGAQQMAHQAFLGADAQNNYHRVVRRQFGPQFRGNFENLFRGATLTLQVLSLQVIHAHNSFLEFWVELGLLGLLAWTWLLSEALGAATGRARWLAIAVCTFALHNAIDATAFIPQVNLLGWVLAGLATHGPPERNKPPRLEG